jgi:glycosyltransferase involved in cell wall biosynthesis
MQASDVVVLPSWIDGMPLAALEAQAAGKPVVASQVGSLPSIILDGETGFLCEPGDVDAFCEKIVRLWGDPELRKAMGENGQARVTQLFGAAGMISRYGAVLERLLEPGKKTPTLGRSEARGPRRDETPTGR